MENVFYAQGLVRIRSLSVELIPEMQPDFIQPTDEQIGGVMPEAFADGRWQVVLTVGAAIAVVNCVVVGAIVGITVDVVLGGHRRQLRRGDPRRGHRSLPVSAAGLEPDQSNTFWTNDPGRTGAGMTSDSRPSDGQAGCVAQLHP